MNGMRARTLERTFIILVGALLAFYFFRLFTIYQDRFHEVPERLGNGTIINLNAGNRAEQLKNLLTRGFYLEDKKDIEFIYRSVSSATAALPGELDNIGELNKKQFDVNADEAFAKGGTSFQKRVKLSRQLLGFNGDDSLRFDQERKAPPPLPAVNEVKLGDASISGKVINRDEAPVAGVLVRLRIILPEDSLYSSIMQTDSSVVVKTAGLEKTYVVDSMGRRQLDHFTAYARTGGDGGFT